MLDERTTIRDAKLDLDLAGFVKGTSGPHEYGLLCAVAEYVSFEVEFSGDSTVSATVLGWNFQWQLSFLSIVAETPIYWPFGVSSSISDKNEKSFKLTNGFGVGVGLRSPEIIEPSELSFFRSHKDKFIELIGNNAFSTAVSIASIHSATPNASLAMTMVWSGIEGILGFDHELRFRIALALAHILTGEGEDRLSAMKHYAKLYDDRSKCVHGSKKPKNLVNSLSESKRILRALILTVIERGRPFERDDWDKLFLGEKF